MRKANKIIMATVAILLCLVLITTSVASGIFAKFVVTKSGEATITFTKFGVTVTMSASGLNKFDSKNKVSAETFKSTGGVITISGLTLAPGDYYGNAVKFTFSTKPSVTAKIVITPTITFYDANGNVVTDAIYNVPASTIKWTDGEYMAAKSYMPIGFTFHYDSSLMVDANYACKPWSNYATSADLQNAIAEGIEGKIAPGGNAATDATVSRANNAVTIGNYSKAINFKITDASNDTTTNRTYFHMGFAYPLEYGSSPEEKAVYDKISEYLAQTYSGYSMTISYSVQVLQV